MLMDELLEKYKVSYTDLDPEEKETLNGWFDALSKTQLTLEKVRSYIVSMREQVEKELVDEPEFLWIFLFRIPNRRQILLKARLKNYMLLDAFLSTPERARQALESQLSSFKKTA